jgi:ornithine cyclodeaminase/alanine dehydrogenase-like protein (mu-crystallin family)
MGVENDERSAVAGAGVQGVATGIAFGVAAPNLRMMIHDVLPSQFERFIARVGPHCPNADFVRCQSAEECVRDADLASTCVPIVGKSPAVS